MMKIWKLANNNETSINWRTEILDRKINYVLVRAENENAARELATEELAKAAVRNPGENSVGSPYLKKTDTSCEPIECAEYSTEGVAEILKIETT